jgi:hypothetical protein
MAGNRDFGDHEQVAETAQVWEAELIAGRLRSEGVDAHVVDQTFRQEPLPASRDFAVVRVLVPKSQVPEARRILATPASPPPDDESGNPEVM